jgi:ribosomal protein S18 acetylase RimI-like enzyme
MLDKSIPYKNIIMKLDWVKNPGISDPELPDGYDFKFFEKGDELRWAELECSVLEFDSTEKALEYFTKDYLPYLAELEKRCVFIVDPQGKYVATANAWWADCDGKHQASLHWVAVHPDYQGKGFGKHVVNKALSLFPVYERNLDVYLHTQTWSHVAINLYYKLGFRLSKTAILGNKGNDYHEAVEVLKPVMKPDVILNLISTAQ